MKLETAIVITKGFCYVLAGFTAPLGTALAQWANEGTWPPAVNWVVILGACLSGAATSLLAFLSSSYSTYKKEMNGRPVPPPEVKP